MGSHQFPVKALGRGRRFSTAGLSPRAGEPLVCPFPFSSALLVFGNWPRSGVLWWLMSAFPAGAWGIPVDQALPSSLALRQSWAVHPIPSLPLIWHRGLKQFPYPLPELMQASQEVRWSCYEVVCIGKTRMHQCAVFPEFSASVSSTTIFDISAQLFFSTVFKSVKF